MLALQGIHQSTFISPTKAAKSTVFIELGCMGVRRWVTFAFNFLIIGRKCLHCKTTKSPMKKL